MDILEIIASTLSHSDDFSKEHEEDREIYLTAAKEVVEALANKGFHITQIPGLTNVAATHIGRSNS